MENTKNTEEVLQGLVLEIFSSMGIDCNSSAPLEKDLLQNLCLGIKYLLLHAEAIEREKKNLKTLLRAIKDESDDDQPNHSS